MSEFKTPGVYIQEISTLPASVASVATAIPAFVGYTKQRIENDETFAINTPKRIRSLLEFEEMFGNSFNEFYNVTLTDPAPGETTPGIGIVFRETGGNSSPYILYHQVRMFFANGGGPCYIVSVGDFVSVATDPLTIPADLPNASDIDKDVLLAGLAACKEIDEITILCVPETVMLTTAANRKEINDAMLSQSAGLQDRFAVIDVLSDSTSSVFNDGNNFRSNDVSSDNLRYGAAYYPQLETLFSYPYLAEQVHIIDSRTAPKYNNQRLSTVDTGIEVNGTDFNTTACMLIRVEDFNNIGLDTLTINGESLVEGTDFNGPFASNSAAATAIETAINANGTLSPVVTAAINGAATTTVVVTVDIAGSGGNSLAATYLDSGSGAAISLQGISLGAGETTITENFTGGSDGIDKELFNAIKAALDQFKIDLYPSGAMAGIYARVDRDRGVWKAPANVSVNRVNAAKIKVTREEQENLNVDATSGKSINAIRYFNGKGILVWGARTLAGNDNEWRYVPVRRFYNFAEESIKKATEFVVFEPNDAKTWIRTKAMIENFLLQLWSAGALAGATSEDAFFVKVGLGETMTPLDILEGRLNIEIGLAVVRPAEFIILKFSHKLQES